MQTNTAFNHFRKPTPDRKTSPSRLDSGCGFNYHSGLAKQYRQRLHILPAPNRFCTLNGCHLFFSTLNRRRLKHSFNQHIVQD